MIGKPAIGKLAPLLEDSNESVRFHSARCMLRLGDNRALKALYKIAETNGSDYRFAAVKAIGENAKRRDAIPILNRIDAADDFDTRIGVYEQLKRLGDISVSQTLVAGDFAIENVYDKGPAVVFVSRRDRPRVILFGKPIRCEDNIFVESSDHSITINSAEGQKYVSVMRKHPRRKRLVGPLRSGRQLPDVIQTLCESPIVDDSAKLRPGLGISYTELVALLEKMCENGGVKAEFKAGPLSTAGAGW